MALPIDLGPAPVKATIHPDCCESFFCGGRSGCRGLFFYIALGPLAVIFILAILHLACVYLDEAPGAGSVRAAWYFRFGGRVLGTVASCPSCDILSAEGRRLFATVRPRNCYCPVTTPADTPWCEDRQARNETGLCQKKERCCASDFDKHGNCMQWVQTTCTSTRLFGIEAGRLVLQPTNGQPTISSGEARVKSAALQPSPKEAEEWGHLGTQVPCCQREENREILWGKDCGYTVDGDCANILLALILLGTIVVALLLVQLGQMLVVCAVDAMARKQIKEFNRTEARAYERMEE